MQPAHKDVGFHAVLKFQGTQRGVHNRRIQVTAALRRRESRYFAKDTKDHGDIMRRKTPQNVLFGPELSQIQARRINVLDFSKMAQLDQPV